MKGALFIGGSKDGARLVVRDETVRVPVYATRNTVSRTVDFEVYHSFRIRGVSQVFTVYALSGMPPDVILGMLISNYQTGLKGKS